MINVSLNKSTNVLYTFSLYIVAYFSLALLGIFIITQNKFLNDRFSDQTIIATHIFTLGFLSTVFTGSFFQLLPVLFGIELKISKKSLLFFVSSIFLCLLAFYYGLLGGLFFQFKFLMLPFCALITLWLNLFYSIAKNFFNNPSKNLKDIHLFLCLMHLMIGALIGFIMVIGHTQLIEINFRPLLTDVHIVILLLGFLLSLVYLIAKNVIPMFFVSNSKQSYHFGIMLFYFFLYLKIYSTYFFSPVVMTFSNIALSLTILLGIVDLANMILTRKRKRSNPVIHLWLLGLVTLVTVIFYNSYNQFSFDENLLLQKFFFIVIKIIISAMVVKIIPFLFWLNLSSLQQKSMKYDLVIPNVNQFFSEKEITGVFTIQIFLLISAIVSTKLFGFVLVFESLYFIFLLIKSYSLFKSVFIKLVS